MTEKGMARLREDLRAIVLGAEGDPATVKIAVERTLKAEPKLILDAWQELLALGSASGHRVSGEVEWARALVNDLLQAVGFEATAERSRYLMPAARGLLDVVAEEIQKYHRA